MSDVAQIIEEIKAKAQNASCIKRAILEKWAEQIHAGKWTSHTNAPPNINADEESMSDSSDFGNDDLSSDGEDQDYGDVVTVKNVQFVVCSGLVVPEAMLKEKIIPMVNEEMKRLGIDVNDVYNALMEDE